MSGGTSMVVAVQRYLDERRQLGFELIAPGTELMRFARYADACHHRGPLTQELIAGWAREHVKRTSAVTAARRLEVVRPFAAYYRQFEPASEIPPQGILGRGHRRLVPHIYTDQEVTQLLQATNRLNPHGGLRPLAYRTLFGLIAAVGLRLSEALNLAVGDVDLVAGAVTVRKTKFRKSRCLPLHSSVVQALGAYRQSRDRCHATDPGTPFFVSQAEAALPTRTVENVFRRMQPHLGWQARGDYPVPRIHDLRHTFAVRRLQRWREEGQSIDHALFWLCTYLGHAKISDTYWYLTGVPELMDSIGARFERFTASGVAS
ncbi:MULTISPECIES: tyrosine-type recombinase/integrase [unclassified Variovorax]|uniref:tyrosine-type recombinase/integrase n=1 Tax=unclassified Variovorax TaxID=663243 RepID=UPI003F44DEE1